MKQKLRVCLRCRDLLEDAYVVRPVSIDSYLSGRKIVKPCCDMCRRRGAEASLFCCEIELPVRRKEGE